MARLFEHPVSILILILIIVLLFGSKRLPDLASGIGKSLRIFKREVRDLADDDDKPGRADATAQPPVAPVVTPPAPGATGTPLAPPVVTPPPAAPAPGTTAEPGTTDPRP
ncbi:twin-arginine translocase TatA/TatE family subunit [Cellulomonas sp. C5510]|uniref:twin-arginine translocase TatA/TatE family subunit n=1 Tax=Cellulomonas sp. C5510 TaxID=2871170 RepID=UPI001C98171A|nr:twin-arginine translocase TatA/TatE family subunit [Cellulomonas sp. C5510]QZN84215.1 twin-arginine translocase TatA/TatE family subunit [Cellulomonas sp. C5510]